MRIILSAFLILQACGTMGGNMAEPVIDRRPAPESPPVSSISTDARVLEALQVWKEDCRRYSSFDCGALLERVDEIKVGKLEQGTLGVARLSGVGFIITRREITIIPEVVDKPALMRAVLAHEMGHAALLINHVNDDTHLMSPYILVDDTLEGRLPAMLQRFYAEAAAKILPRIE